MVFQETERTPGITFICIGHVSSIFVLALWVVLWRVFVVFVVVGCLISGTWIS